MENRVIRVPVSLLHDPDLTVHEKLVWLALRLEPDAGPARVQGLTGLSRHTVLNGLARAAAFRSYRTGNRVEMPVALLAERGVGARAKVLYGLLQTLPTLRGKSGKFTYATLSALTKVGPKTLRRAMFELGGAGWVRPKQKTRLSAITFRLGTPEQRAREAAVARAGRRLDHARHKGEALMKEYLSLLIESDGFADNVRLGHLVNPETQEPLELDRYYGSDRVAFEFNGDQHYRASGRFTQQEVDAQRKRDLIKAGLCVYEQIHLVIIRDEDLSLWGMIRKVGKWMPRRCLDGQDRLIELLEEASIKYFAVAQAARTGGG